MSKFLQQIIIVVPQQIGIFFGVGRYSVWCLRPIISRRGYVQGGFAVPRPAGVIQCMW